MNYSHVSVIIFRLFFIMYVSLYFTCNETVLVPGLVVLNVLPGFRLLLLRCI